MNVDHESTLPEYPLYEVDLDSPDEVELDYGYHSIGKNIKVNKTCNMFTVTTCREQRKSTFELI